MRGLAVHSGLLTLGHSSSNDCCMLLDATHFCEIHVARFDADQTYTLGHVFQPAYRAASLKGHEVMGRRPVLAFRLRSAYAIHE